MIVIPVYKTIIMSDATLFFQIEQLRKASGGKGVSVNEKVVLIVAKDKESSIDFKDDGFYPIGLSGIITDLNHHGYATIRTQYRVNLENVFVQPDRTIQLVVSKRNDVQDLPEDIEAEKLKDLKSEMKRFSDGFEFADSAKLMIEQIDSIGAAACVMSYIITNSNEECYAILSEDSVRKRTGMVEKMLYEYMEVGRIAKEAMTSQQREYQQQYREAAIKRQMEHLQKELDEMHP
ncbi:MAG TPA: endopeptidase La, partial [Spirochaetaceae bacterium]|nr:endopeptidase La [Spirochaetaceae bacterium]